MYVCVDRPYSQQMMPEDPNAVNKIIAECVASRLRTYIIVVVGGDYGDGDDGRSAG